jgi:UPF0755 protein
MKHKRNKIILSVAAIIICAVILLIYSILFGYNVKPSNQKANLYIPSGSTYIQVLDTLTANLDIKNYKIFGWIAAKKRYPDLIKSGRYVIDREITYNGLINLLRSGNQTPVKVTFNNVRYLTDLARKVGGQIEADSAELIEFLKNPENYSNDGFTREDVISVFIPNTYEFFWNTDAKGFYERMHKEYSRFWNDERLNKAKALNLSQTEVSILASIIDDEVTKADEKPRIAGVYLNRIRRRIPLQACPTIKFALNDFSITRVLNEHLTVNSPYNTYKYRGFPPGPIGCPTIEGIEAVLNAENHDYLYFAAKADFSGYHNFSRTLSEHNRYAAEYQRELNRRKIYR